MLDNLNIHSAPDVLLFSLLHPRWEFVFQPKYAAYLNLIEPWWKVLRSLALKGRRFEAWAEIEQAVARATAYWNEHRHPFIWGRRRRHRHSRRLGIAAVPNLTDLADAPLRAGFRYGPTNSLWHNPEYGCARQPPEASGQAAAH